jgi:citrate lyase beta subunit
MLKYDPTDAKKRDLLDEGEYVATIEDVTKKISKKAAARGETKENMYEVVLRVDALRIWDYITIPEGTWKLEQIAKALGDADAFAAGTFDLEKKVGATVNVYLRAKTDAFGTKMQVGEWKPAHRDFGSTGHEKVEVPVAAGADDDSEVPF